MVLLGSAGPCDESGSLVSNGSDENRRRVLGVQGYWVRFRGILKRQYNEILKGAVEELEEALGVLLRLQHFEEVPEF